MDLLSIILGAGFVLFAVLAFYLSRTGNKGKPRKTQENLNEADEGAKVRRPEPLDEGLIVGGRRVVRQRNRPARPRVQDAFDRSGSEPDDELDNPLPDIAVADGSTGAKKRKKLEAKAEKRAQRQAELTEREERKEREARLEEERKRKEALERIAEDQRLEVERKEKEDQEQREHEQYLKLKESFQIMEEGVEEEIDVDSQNILQEFIEYIKSKKVVQLEDLAAQFKLRTPDCIDRILKLQTEGQLTGVIDDRGKFIYISMDELQAVAKFVKQRGRVSISDLAESSNKLIRLQTGDVKG